MDYTYTVNGVTHGPYTPRELWHKVHHGEIQADQIVNPVDSAWPSMPVVFAYDPEPQQAAEIERQRRHFEEVRRNAGLPAQYVNTGWMWPYLLFALFAALTVQAFPHTIHKSSDVLFWLASVILTVACGYWIVRRWCKSKE